MAHKAFEPMHPRRVGAFLRLLSTSGCSLAVTNQTYHLSSVRRPLLEQTPNSGRPILSTDVRVSKASLQVTFKMSYDHFSFLTLL